MILVRASASLAGLILYSLAAATWYPTSAPGGALPRVQSSGAKQESGRSTTEAPKSPLPRGKKLVLKDGGFQLVRSYERHGERVRYYSVERGDWEEIPAAIVDWDATAKAEAAEKETAEELASNASLTVAPGVFLPPGEGMFLVEGKAVTKLGQVGSEVKVDKKTVLKQVLSPVPIIPSKHNVEIPGARAETRITTNSPEFYLREAPPDPDRVSAVQRSSRPGESGPEVELVRAKVKGGKRVLESIRSLFGQELSPDRDVISMQRWDIAVTVFRFTLSEPLPQGEYALAEILPDGMNVYVWDFGVDGPSVTKPAKR